MAERDERLNKRWVSSGCPSQRQFHHRNHERQRLAIDISTEAGGALARFFAALIKRRWWVIACYALLLPPSAYYAAKVGQDNSIDRLIVATDPDYVATRAFEQVFGGGEFALLLVEAPDPLAPEVITSSMRSSAPSRATHA